MSLRDQHVVVVGGSSGIGFAVAAAALAEGARVTIASSRADKVEAAAGRLGSGATGVVLNVLNAAEVSRVFEGIGALDHLVFTAGDWGGPRGVVLADLDLEAARGVFGVRFWGAVAVVKAATPRVSLTGSITLTNGMIAHRPRPGAAVSSAMAGAVEHLAQSLAVELAPVRINCVCPGYVRTEVWDSLPAEDREARLKAFTRAQPLARVGEPDELARAYLYLMTAGYTTGQVLRVEGGLSRV